MVSTRTAPVANKGLIAYEEPRREHILVEVLVTMDYLDETERNS